MPSCWMLRTVTTTRAAWLPRDWNTSRGRRILPAVPSSIELIVMGPCSKEQWSGGLLQAASHSATSPLSGPTSLAPGTNSAPLRWVLLSKTARSPRADPSHQCSTAKGQTRGQTPGGVLAWCHPVGHGPLARLGHARALGQVGGVRSDIFLWASSLGSDGQRGRAIPQCTQLAQGLLGTGCWSCCRSRKQLQV